MAEAAFIFPPGFLWGTATSSHQVEGGNINNDWYSWEKEGNILEGQYSNAACEWLSGNWQEDFDRAADSGQNTHRFSLEWSRIQPAPNRFDDSEIAFYREMACGLRQRGLQPMVTLHHFTNPIWLQEMHGWESDFIVDYFRDYVYRVVNALHEYVDLWCTINEPTLYAVKSSFLGNFPPGKKRLRATVQMLKNMVKAHAAAYQEIHNIQPEAKVGVAHSFHTFSPIKTQPPFDRWVAKILSWNFNEVFPLTLSRGLFRVLGIRTSIPQAKGTQDYFGLSYSNPVYVSFDPLSPQKGFIRRYPDSTGRLGMNRFMVEERNLFYRAIRWAYGYNLPIYITKDGIDDAGDELRPQYLLEHIHQLWRAVNFNWHIRGYYHWTLVDNFAWERGWASRYGLWEINTETQERIRRRSADFYEAICKENALTSNQVSFFVPELKQKMFPG